ncbi:MAG: MurR/RpiR family transcriptional regulator [Bacilli bacterium]
MIPIRSKSKITQKEQIIFDWLHIVREDVLSIPESEIAERLGVSPATVSRFWKKIGFQNFREFKTELRVQLQIGSLDKFQKTVDSIERFSLQTYAKDATRYLEETAKRNDSPTIDKCVSLLSNATHLYIFASGPAISCAELLAFRLTRFGIRTTVVRETGHSIHETLIQIEPTDTILCFLLSNVHPETYVVCDFAARNNVACIVITDLFLHPPFIETHTILQVVRGELHAFHSMVGVILLVETLIVHVGHYCTKVAEERLQELEHLRLTYESYVPRKVALHPKSNN